MLHHKRHLKDNRQTFDGEQVALDLEQNFSREKKG